MWKCGLFNERNDQYYSSVAAQYRPAIDSSENIILLMTILSNEESNNEVCVSVMSNND